MGLGKTYSTKYLVDSNGNTGAANQVLVSTATGVDWADGSGSGIIGGPYLPLAGGTMTGTNGVLFPDNFKLNIGTGSDLQIYHDGSNSFIEDVGTGSLLLKSNGAGIYLKGFTSTDTYAQFLEGGAVNLYYDDSKKFETTSTGVTVTGGGIFTGNVSGVAGTFTGNLAVGTASSAEIYLNRNSANYINAANATGYLVFRTAGAVTALTLNASQNATFAGTVTSPTFLGDLNGTINTATTGVTQTAGDNSTKIATTAYADAAAAAVPIGNYLPLAGGTMTGNLNINTSTNFPLLLTGTNASYTAIGIKNTGTGDAGIYMDGINGDFSGSDYAFIGQKDEGYLLYNIGASSPLPYHVFTGGNVGIGTTSPGAKLDVVGTTKVGEGVASNTSKLMVNTLSGTAAGIQLFQDGVESWIIQNPASTTALTFGNSGSERMRITSGGNVGIGTTTPGNLLHIHASGANASALIIEDDARRLQLGRDMIESRNADGSSVTALYIQPNGNTSFASTSGSVGIGTTSPSYKLDVNGNIRGTGTSQLGHLNCISTLSFGAFTTGTQGTLFEGYSTHSVVRTDSARLDFYMGKTTTGVGTMMSLTDTGRVGIGTTNPGEKTTIFTSNESLHDVLGVYNGVTGTSALGKGAAIRIGNYTDGQYSTKIATIYEGNNPDYLQPALAFFTMNNTYLKGSEVERMRISANGNVGIGTTSPGASLHITTDGAAGTFRLSPQDGTYEDYRLDIRAQASDAGALTMKLKDNTFLKTYGYYNLTGVSHGVAGYEDLLHLKNNGNVGIGTTSPITKLHVFEAGTAMIRVDSGATSPYKAGIEFLRSSINGGRIYNDGDAVQVKLESDFAYDAANPTRGGFMFKTAPVTSGTLVDAVRIDARGNVGIGTTILTAPSYGAIPHLAVANVSGATLQLRNSTSNTLVGNTLGRIQFTSSYINSPYAAGNIRAIAANSASGGASGGAHILFETSLGNTGSLVLERMRITNSGNVSIGNSNDTYKLDVSGTGRFTSTVTATNFILSSDKTLKDNISDINTDHIDAKWKNFELKSEPGVKRAGVVAQELEENHPEFVRTDKDGIKSVAYIDLLIAKIAELEVRLEKLEK